MSTTAGPDACREACACDACGDMIRLKHVRPVRMPGRYQFNFHVMLDTLFAQDAEGKTHAFLNTVCDGTRFQIVAFLHAGSGMPTAKVALETFLMCWASWAGLPQSIFVDRGREVRNAVRQFPKTAPP